MPHSSGGGSHSGGFHSGSGGSRSQRVSTHYFPGARRYIRHNHTLGKDEYVYASSKPTKFFKNVAGCTPALVGWYSKIMMLRSFILPLPPMLCKGGKAIERFSESGSYFEVLGVRPFFLQNKKDPSPVGQCH